MAPFVNEPVLELRRAAVRGRLPEALSALDARLPLTVPVLVGGSGSTAGSALPSTDPGNPERLVARAHATTPGEIDAALATARTAQPAWAQAGAHARAAALVKAAAILREQRLELAALAVRECAKPWPEADGDVCEAIDFLEYYARQALELEGDHGLIQPPGERNDLQYRPRGIVAVISPWNFPLAIPCGMTAAALVTGNAALLKPAEQSPGCALRLVQALHAGGVPRDVLALLPGEGDVGAALVASPGVHAIAFTGSLPVGLTAAATSRRGATTSSRRRPTRPGLSARSARPTRPSSATTGAGSPRGRSPRTSRRRYAGSPSFPWRIRCGCAPGCCRARCGPRGASEPDGQAKRGGYPLAFQPPMTPERQLVRNGGALVESILSSWSAPGWPDKETAQTYQRAMRIPPVAHTSLEYHRWFVRSTFRPDGLRYARRMRRPIHLHARRYAALYEDLVAGRPASRWEKEARGALAT